MNKTKIIFLTAVLLILPASFLFAASSPHYARNPIRYKKSAGGLPTPAQIVIGVTPKDTNGNPTPPFTPAQIQQAYNLGAFSDGGSGETIVIVDAYAGDTTITTDIASFDAAFNLPAPTINIYSVDGPPDTDPFWPDWELETALDVEWAHALAPYATIDVVLAPNAYYDDLLDAITYAVNNLNPTVISMSWGGPEIYLDSSVFTPYETVFTTAVNNGIILLASSGDDGAYDGTYPPSLSANYPPSSPEVIGVGGTTLTLDSSGNYGSEVVWDNDEYSATGGGYSTYFTEPSYQSTAEITDPTNMRGVPDVAFDADPNTGVYVYLYGVLYGGIGGTSLSSPCWAGIVADNAAANPTRSINLAYLYGTVYGVSGNSTLYPTDIHDITSGNNNYYTAGIGWDACTGIGSPNVSNFLSTPLPVTAITVASGPSYNTGSTLYVTSSSNTTSLLGSTKFQITATSPIGIASGYYKLDSDAPSGDPSWISYYSPSSHYIIFSVTSSDTSIWGYAEDVDDDTEIPHKEKLFTICDTPPSGSTLSLVNSTGGVIPIAPTGWYNEYTGAPYIKITGTTDVGGPGVAGVWYTLDGSTPGLSSSVYSAPVKINNAQVDAGNLKYAGFDYLKNEETPQAYPNQIWVDTLPPVTTITVDFNTNTFTLSATDALSGVATTQYSLDNGNTWSVYTTGSISIPTTSTTTKILAQSTDIAGNIEDPPARVWLSANTPTALSGTLGEDDKVYLTWNYQSNGAPLIGFYVYRSTNPGDPSSWLLTGATTPSQTLYTDAPSAGTYYYRVAAYNNYGQTYATATGGGNTVTVTVLSLNSGGGGGGPLGPLAIGISGLLTWLKRKKNKKRF